MRISERLERHIQDHWYLDIFNLKEGSKYLLLLSIDYSVIGSWDWELEKATFLNSDGPYLAFKLDKTKDILELGATEYLRQWYVIEAC